MTIAGFRSQNHPQQIAIRGAKADIDSRGTSPELFDMLNARFDFSVDVAASRSNAKCRRYFTSEDDGLMQPWAGERVWCNPPYSGIAPWIEKAWMECDSADLIAMLLPANRTEQPWWQTLVEPYRDNGSGLRVEFLAGRHRFTKLDTFIDLFGRPRGGGERPPFGCCLLIWSNR
jgi:phage N-6-adenine-methyltransferase